VVPSRRGGYLRCLPLSLSACAEGGPPQTEGSTALSRPYETVLIFDSSLDESQIEEKIERFKRILARDKKPPAQSVPWGKRKLAYPIGKREQGIYVVVRFEADSDALQEFERVVRLDEQVLRHLTIVNPPESAIAGAGASTHAPRERRAVSEEE